MIAISYGGYAALAAGAFSPFGYKCIASVNGVSDLPEMLRDARSRFGSNHWVVDYWQNQFGSESAERTALKAISPAEHAGAFRVPVLLLHGRDDAVVPLDQSTRMEKALKRAKEAGHAGAPRRRGSLPVARRYPCRGIARAGGLCRRAPVVRRPRGGLLQPFVPSDWQSA